VISIKLGGRTTSPIGKLYLRNSALFLTGCNLYASHSLLSAFLHQKRFACMENERHIQANILDTSPERQKWLALSTASAAFSSPTIKSSDQIWKALLRMQCSLLRTTLCPMQKKNTNGSMRNVIHEQSITMYGPIQGTILTPMIGFFILSSPIAARSPMAIPDGERIRYCRHRKYIPEEPLDDKTRKVLCGNAHLRRCSEMKDNKPKVTAFEGIGNSCSA
jgi:hypothetical protein